MYRALRELAFDHEAGHLSDDDYEALRAPTRAGRRDLGALDALGPASPPPEPAVPVAPAPPAGRGLLRHPAALVGGALILVVFGVVIGLNAGRFLAAPDQTMIPPGSRIPVPATPEPGSMPPVAGIEPGKSIPPEMLAGMLQAARASLAAERYPEAIAAYQAVLKRDPRNVDAMTHLGLIVAIGGHADAALEAFNKVLAIDSLRPRVPLSGPDPLRGQQRRLSRRRQGLGALSRPGPRRGRSPARGGPRQGRARQVGVSLTSPVQASLFRIDTRCYLG